MSDNSAQNGSGGGIFNHGQLLLTNVTLSNSAGIGGAAHNPYLFSGTLALTNSILTFSAPPGLNCFGAGDPNSFSDGHNLASDTSCSLTGSGDQQPVDPLLGPSVYNGWPRAGVGGDPMLTRIPQAGSPAIDAIPISIFGCGTARITDQRGAPRPIHGKCDLGAVESGWV